MNFTFSNDNQFPSNKINLLGEKLIYCSVVSTHSNFIYSYLKRLVGIIMSVSGIHKCYINRKLDLERYSQFFSNICLPNF